MQKTMAAVALISVPAGLFSLLWAAALVAACDDLLHGQQPSVLGVYGRALRRVPSILLGAIVFFLVMTALTILATVLFVVTGFGLLGSLIALVGLLFWWLRPTARRAWLRWLIVLTTPYGLPTYVAFRWAMYLAAVVLERRGPVGAFSRSGELTANQWFRVASILTIAPLIVGILISVVTTLVNVPLSIAALTRGQVGLDPAAAAFSTSVAIVLQILVQSLAIIVYTQLFHDLRNRREGTDIGERLSALEASPLPADG